MAVTQSTVYNPEFSFFTNFTPEANCEQLTMPCLPIKNISDLAWQIPIITLGNNDGEGRTRTIKAAALKINCEDFEFPDNESLRPAWQGHIYELDDSSPNEALGYLFQEEEASWELYNSYLADPINVGDCFRIFTYEEIRRDSDTLLRGRFLLSCSQCFQRVADDCNLSHIEYKCNENAFGFIYDDPAITQPVPNKIILPFTLTTPQLTSDSDVIVLSTQQVIKLFEVVDEEFILETSAWPYDWHRKFKIALSHDVLVIRNTNIKQYVNLSGSQFVADADYKLKWQKKPSLLAKGEGKVRNAVSKQMRNLNCG